MIWVWIILALALSYLPLINKKIELSCYMWLLIPIDAYGVSLAGAVIKPYMIFALILPIVLYAKSKGSEFQLTADKNQIVLGIITVLLLIVNLFNCDDLSSIKAAFMTLVVYLCAQFYTSCTDISKIEQLSDVFIASCFGSGLVFILCYLLLNNDINIPGIVATTRAEDGIFLQLRNMLNGKYMEIYRLRGYAYDPNTMFVQFIFGISACVSRLFKKFNLYYIFTLIISVFCVLLSSSRMGLLCAIITIVITSAISISKFKTVKKKIASITTILIVIVSFLCLTITKVGQSFITTLFSTYSNRSSLTDEYGRFSIWNECIKIYWEKNPLFGVGLGKMDEYTTTARMTHNTWLQFICECGLIIGSIAIIYFLTVLVIGWAKTKQISKFSPDNTSYLCLVIGYTMTIVSLVSADNITCSYLWFSALLILKMLSHITHDSTKDTLLNYKS